MAIERWGRVDSVHYRTYLLEQLRLEIGDVFTLGLDEVPTVVLPQKGVIVVSGVGPYITPGSVVRILLQPSVGDVAQPIGCAALVEKELFEGSGMICKVAVSGDVGAGMSVHVYQKGLLRPELSGKRDVAENRVAAKLASLTTPMKKQPYYKQPRDFALICIALLDRYSPPVLVGVIEKLVARYKSNPENALTILPAFLESKLPIPWRELPRHLRVKQAGPHCNIDDLSLEDAEELEKGWQHSLLLSLLQIAAYQCDTAKLLQEIAEIYNATMQY